MVPAAYHSQPALQNTGKALLDGQSGPLVGPGGRSGPAAGSVPVAAGTRARVDTIIFDLDGVLVDSGLDIANAVNYVLGELGRAQLPSRTIIGFIGGGAEPIVRQSLGADAEALFSVAFPMFTRRYQDHCTAETILYPGMDVVLQHWARAGKPMGIATNKVQDVTRKVLEHLHVADYFRMVVGPEDVQYRKPHPEALLQIMQQLAALPQRTLMIGDTAADILAGKAAGTLTCGVTYGYGKVEEIQAASPDFLVDRPEELLGHIE